MIDYKRNFPFHDAYSFLAERGFEKESSEIRNSPDRYKSYSATLKRAKIIALVQEKKLLDKFLNSVWQSGLSEKGEKRIKFLENLVNRFNNDSDETGSEDEDEILKEENKFALEAHLQDFLIRNLGTIRKHKLVLFESKDGKGGKEYPTQVGPIDILTTDEYGDFYVFETKLSRGMDKALGQLLRYMGWVKVNLAKDKKVYGIIVANEMDGKIKYAVEMTPNVSLCEYEIKFDIKFLNKR